MLNFDKYREEIFEEIEIAMKGSSPAPIVLAVSRVHNRHTGEKCDFFEPELEWLFSEYEPPLLENGDDLNPGEWIMVSDDDDCSVTWYKNRFVCYYNATFFVVDDNGNDSFNENGTNITGWKYARLPEDGECK